MAHIHELYDFTVSFLVLHPNEKKILLHFHRKLGFWNQLGGHIELDEHPIEALERELKEEAGLNPEDYEIIQTTSQIVPRNTISLPVGFGLYVYDYADSGHKHIDIPYLIKSKTTNIDPAEGESKQIGWFDKQQIETMYQDGQMDISIYDICQWIFDTIL